MTRLDNYLSKALGIGRQEAKKEIRKGLVTVNKECIKSPDYKFNETEDIVSYKGEEISYKEFVYYMLNKPAGYVSATRDNLHQTVVELINDKNHDLFPVGRLDIDTEGLLILTNDGDLGHHLTSPAHHVDKTYFARVTGSISLSDIDAFGAGLDYGEEEPSKPALLMIDKENSDQSTDVYVTIQEGKFHQVKRMFKAIDHEVLYLKRVAMGSLLLDKDLKPSEYRELTENEIKGLKN